MCSCRSGYTLNANGKTCNGELHYQCTVQHSQYVTEQVSTCMLQVILSRLTSRGPYNIANVHYVNSTDSESSDNKRRLGAPFKVLSE